MRLSSQPGILGLLIGFAAGFLMYASNTTAGIAVVGVIGTAVLFGIANSHWVIEIFSVVPAISAGALCGLEAVVWKQDPTAHNLWPLELLMVSLTMTLLLLLLGGGGVLVRRHLLHRTVEPGPPALVPGWTVPLATIAAIVGYVLIRGAMQAAR